MADDKYKQETGSGTGRKGFTNAGTKTFNLIVDGVAYLVKATPFNFNEQTRFYVSVDNGDDHVFAWDSELAGLRIIDDESEIIPSALEEAISRELQSRR